MNTEDIYTLEELIEKLDRIKNEKEGSLNIPKALYTLSIEIKELKIDYKKRRERKKKS